MVQDHQEYSSKEIEVLEHFVTNTDKDIFCLRNLPEVIKGAVFSRYSRSTLGLRALLLKDFISNEEETAFGAIAGSNTEDNEQGSKQIAAIQKAQNFYDRILDGYGDDSIGELGGAHLAIENVSMIGAKAIEDCRIGGSPLEKSTRYVYFDQKINGDYQYYREPILMTSAYRDLYQKTCDRLFETYGALIQPLTALIQKDFPITEGMSKVAYKASLRAKVLDCLRGLLPAGTLTNMGVYGNGRFFETLIHKLQSHNLSELQDIGKTSFDELSKIIPSFVRRAQPSHRHHVAFAQYNEALQSELKLVTEQHTNFSAATSSASVRLVSADPNNTLNVASALLYEHGNKGMDDIRKHCQRLSDEDIARILDAACNNRENRRHKSPRALEHASFTFEIVADFGVYRDLHRHRMLTQERQLLSCDYGYYVPHEIIGTEMESTYCDALDEAKRAYDSIASELPEEGQYVVPMAYNVRWYFHINLRALQWLCELRSAPAGHTTYRHVAQEMAKAISDTYPEFARFFKFVDYDNHNLGRLGQEQRKVEKLQSHI